MAIAPLVQRILGPDAPVGVRAYDGSTAGPVDAVATIVLRSPDALKRVLAAPGDLGVGRAYVAGELDVEGDLLAALTELGPNGTHLDARTIADLLKELRAHGFKPPAPPPEESHLHGRRHSPERDAAAIAHHYDVSNDFYRLVLGPSMTYSCAVWEDPSVGIDAAQAAKHELVCRKLGLEPGMRLLDVGCGWGSMALHAAAQHGARVVGVTISERQVALARKRVAEAGLDGQVEIRLQDYRDVDDGPFDAISSVGMVEHVGRAKLPVYFSHLRDLLRPGGRLLNHGITRRAYAADARPVRTPVPPWRKRTFVERFVFPDGELQEVGQVISVLHQQGLELRHSETLREHYALTLRAWLANLDASWDAAVAEAGEGRARVWKLYMSGSAVAFDVGAIQVHQLLTVKPDRGRSGMPLRPRFETVAAPVPTPTA